MDKLSNDFHPFNQCLEIPSQYFLYTLENHTYKVNQEAIFLLYLPLLSLCKCDSTTSFRGESYETYCKLFWKGSPLVRVVEKSMTKEEKCAE